MTAQPIFATSLDGSVEGRRSALLCPGCGGDYIHHDRVEVFECGEDEETGLHVVVRDGKATIDKSLVGNPSARRHGLRIRFYCELCPVKSVLTLSQHKGNTFVDFSPVEERS